ncbi:MAG: adenylate/guanylate cyclase domain-containing protein [Rectinemataceae bacterium]|jgi:adenylate cyclase
MAKKRAKFLETRTFGFVIAAAVIGLILAFTYGTGMLQTLELKANDANFRLKLAQKGKTVQEGSTYSEKNTKTSEDILIVGIDFNSLTKYGRWPFPRSRHADLVNAFARIKDQSSRESAILLDILFADPNQDPAEDKLLSETIAKSGRVFLETQLKADTNETTTAADFAARSQILADRLGTIVKIKGDWRKTSPFLSVEPPLADYARAAAGYGHANFIPDPDEVFRRQPLVARLSSLVDTLRLDSLTPGYTVDSSKFERLSWMDKNGDFHDIDTPLTESSIALLKARMEKEAPVKVEAGASGQNGNQFYIVRKYRDQFVPAITLALAANYFGVKIADIDVVLGDRIRIPSPTRYDPDTGERKPYELSVTPDQFDKDGNLVKEGKRRVLDKIEIPIDSNGMMLVNFMGPPSSDSADGIQTFPVRSYAGYAEKAPGPNPATWRRTMAAGNKIIMVGAFSSGMAADQKTTPLGLMFGIEMHANALNSILMDNFLRPIPKWVDLAILALLVFIVAFMTSRLPTILSLFGTLVLIVGFFFATTLTFDYRSTLVNFSSPALGMIFTFLTIVVYRAMTEERDKKAIRETFGKYLSPKVVDQLVENPPELGGVDKDLTVLFSDIRSFTTLSESMSPQELVNHLNTYLTAMTDVIFEYGGYLDKYVGDEVMCFWGAPLPQADHAVLACKCALRQMQRLRELNEVWPETIRINIGIGLNSGIMTVGNMGSPTRMNYTLMGDNVNLGARLEGTNKEYGTNIIISEFTYGLVRDHFLVRELDNIRVKGKNKPVLIYELVDCLEDIAPPPLETGAGRRAKK